MNPCRAKEMVVLCGDGAWARNVGELDLYRSTAESIHAAIHRHRYIIHP